LKNYASPSRDAQERNSSRFKSYWRTFVTISSPVCPRMRRTIRTLLCLEQLESRSLPSLPAPTAWWKLDDLNLNGPIDDSSPGAANPATASNFAAPYGATEDLQETPFAGSQRAARVFDGKNDAIQTNNALNLSGNQITIAAWVKVNLFPLNAPFISSVAGIEDWNGQQLQNTALIRIGDLNTPRVAQFVLDIGGNQVRLTGTTALKGEYWYHIAATYDGSKMVLYVNGQQEAVANQVGAVTANGKFFLGSNALPGRTLDGTLDDVRVYKSALTASQIAELMTGRPPTAPGFAVWPVVPKHYANSIPNEEHQLLNGFGDGVPARPLYKWKFHNGIDISASGKGGESVVAARSGWVVADILQQNMPGDIAKGAGVIIRTLVPVGLSGFQTQYDFYLHMARLEVPSDTWVSQGQVIGHIARVYDDPAAPPGTLSNVAQHLHFMTATSVLPAAQSYAPDSGYLNPLTEFASTADQDPMGGTPKLADTNGDGKTLFLVAHGTTTP
jgi:hypothetical protein